MQRHTGTITKKWGPPGTSLLFTCWWLAPLVFFLCVTMRACSANKLALLAGTLRTFQRHECQGSNLALQCPSNTTIDILHANYGGARPPLCPLPKGSLKKLQYTGRRCTYPDSVNYKTIKTVASLCRSKRYCEIPVPAPWEISEEDPCPDVNKYIEVAFKCRPDMFINKILCENERLTLNCGPESRIAIYNALFGRTKDGSELCPQHRGYPEDECQASSVTEIVMRDCHGESECNIEASVKVFGNPCPVEYAIYMKVVYTCVPDWILKPSNQQIQKENAEQPIFKSTEITKTRNPKDSLPTEEYSQDRRPRPTHVDHNHVVKSSLVPPTPSRYPATKLHPSYNNSDPFEGRKITTNELINCTVTILSGSRNKQVGIIAEWMRAIAFINKHFEKFVLYLIVGLTVGILLFLVTISIHLLRDRRKLKTQAKEVNQFIADIEEVDGDIDMMTPTNSSSEGYSPTPREQYSATLREPLSSSQPPRAAIVRYNTGPRLGSSRYNDVDLIPPRSLSRENNHYLYS